MDTKKIDPEKQVTLARQLVEGQPVTYHYAGVAYEGTVKYITDNTAIVDVPALQGVGRRRAMFSLKTSLDVRTGDYLPEVVTARNVKETAKSEYHALNHADADGILRIANEIAEELGLGSVTFKFSSCKRAVGRARATRNNFTRALSDMRVLLSRAWFIDIGMPRIIEALVEEGKPREEAERFLDDVIRHELAHIMDYVDRGTSDHGPVWKQKCRETGADPTRTCDVPAEMQKLIAPWMRECDACGNRTYYYAKPKVDAARACHACCKEHSGGKYDEQFRLAVRQNPDYEA